MEDGFLTPEQDAELRDFWEQINSMTILNREMIKLMEQDGIKQDFASDLKSIHDDLMDWINRVHQMTGPARLEIAEAIVETKTASGHEIPITANFFIGDIIVACQALQERLKG